MFYCRDIGVIYVLIGYNKYETPVNDSISTLNLGGEKLINFRW